MCVEPAMAMARSMAMWLLIAVAIVRRTNLRTLENHLFLGLAVDWVSLDSCRCRSVDAAGLTSLGPAGSDLLRRIDIGHEDSLFFKDGGGGKGAEFISPMRSRVRVS